MSYNILAEIYATRMAYPYCDNWLVFRFEREREREREIVFSLILKYMFYHSRTICCFFRMLAWPYRRSLILQEIYSIEADVVCLQELQSDHYEQDILPQVLYICILYAPMCLVQLQLSCSLLE